MQKKHTFQGVDPHIHFPYLEERVIAYWKKNRIFEKSISMRPKDIQWTFLDGPPFITGLPHYGSLLSSIPKDLFPRYWTMKGYRVRRVWGWDCHGLPAENKVEEKLGLKRKKDIEEKVGVEKFIDECKLYVKNVSSEWEWYVDHIGRWVDFKNAYKTMDLPYMESVMWVFKKMYEKGYIYKGLRVSLYCPHCATPISNFEVAMDQDNYKDVTEATATYKYKLVNEPNTFLLAWSTTPWNKLATPALAVNPKLKYVKVAQNDELYILAKSTLKMLKGKYKVVDEFSGNSLVGKKFEPHFTFYKIEPDKKAFIVVGGDFVTADEGTGVVTIAAYGEEDLAVMLRDNIQLVLHVNEEGKLKNEVPLWAGKYYLDVDRLVIADLTKRGLIYKLDQYTHSVPTCWRCHTRLYYAPQDAWYVKVQSLKDKMRQTNEPVNWVPAHFKYGRYLKSLEVAPDWCISRSRYWGSPVPVWECECGQRFVPGSLAELEKAAGTKITDLHKPVIDEVTVTCEKCGRKAHRVPEVLDSWIEAGSASLAERHYPFAKSENLEVFFPPDFIVEYTGQIRAWFYVLHVISTALFEREAFKNVVVTGVILGTDGRKMSKNYGNYPDPREMLTKYGGDALRLYLMSSPVMKGEDIRISEGEYRNQVRGLMLILWNVYNFFINYALVDKWNPYPTKQSEPNTHVLDIWIVSKLNILVIEVTKLLEAYDTSAAVSVVQIFITDLSQWYVRRSRDRVSLTADDQVDKAACYQTLYDVLVTVCRLLAPFIPFVTENMYCNLTGEASVHLSNWPKAQESLINTSIEAKMKIIRGLVERVHAMRKKNNIKIRQPLQTLWLFGEKNKEKARWQDYEELLKAELNVKQIEYHLYQEVASDPKKLETTSSEEPYKASTRFYLDTEITPELKAEGMARDLVRQIQQLRKEKGCKIDEQVNMQVPRKYKDIITGKQLEDVKRKTLTEKLVWADELSLSTG